MLRVLSGVNVESKAVNVESDDAGSGFARQIRFGGGDFLGCGGQAEQERRPFHAPLKKSIYQALGFNRRLCERDGSGLCLARSFYAKQRK